MTQIETQGSGSVAAPTFSIVSIIAALCAVFAFRAGAAMGLILAILAIAFGVVGALMAVLPSRRGGMISVFAIVAGLIGIIVAIFRLIGSVF